MSGFKHILFPVDFSERSCAAGPFIEAMANRFDAKVTLISVAQPVYYTGLGDPGGPVMVGTESLLLDLEERLSCAFTREYAHLRVTRVAEIGDPARVITQFAHSAGVDLIMMPTHGYGPFRQLLLGSVAAKVLHDSECPVWTAAHVDEHPCMDHMACRNIICAVDGTEDSVRLIKWAAALAGDLGASLRLVHVITDAVHSHRHTFDSGRDRGLRDDAEEAILKLEEAAGVSAPICLMAGSVTDSVHEEAIRHNADMVIIGRGKMQETLGRLRTHAYGIIRQSPCPVLSV